MSKGNGSLLKLDPERRKALQAIVEAISGAMGGLPASLWVADEEEQYLRIAAAVGVRPSYIEEAILYLDEPSVAGDCFLSGQPQMVVSIARDRRWKYKEEAEEIGWESYLSVPVRVGEEVVGVLGVYSFVERSFSPIEQQLLTDYASQASLRVESERMRQFFQKLLDIARKLDRLAIEDPQAVLRQVVQDAREITRADCVALYPYDLDREDFYEIEKVAASGLHKPLKLSDKPRQTGGMAAYVKREKEVVVENIQEEDPAMLKSPFIDREGVQAFMGLALEVAEGTVGILYIDYRSPHKFSDEEKNVIRLFARQVAIAIHNTWLYEEAQTSLQERVDDIKALQGIYALIGTAPTEDMLKEIAEEAARLTPAKYTGIWLLDEQTQELRFGARNEREAPIRTWPKIPVDETSISGHVVLTGETYLCDDVQDDPYYAEWYEDTQSELTTPLIYSDKVIGILNLESTEVGAFTKDHKRLVEALAGAAAVAIQSARLYERLDTLAVVGQTATSTLDLDEVLDRILQESLEALGANYGTLRLLDRTTSELKLQAHRGEVSDRTHESIQLGEGITGWVAQHGKPFLAGDVQEEPQYLEYLADTRCELAVPINVEDTTVGVLNIEHPQPHAFDEHDMHLLEAIASQVATAIRNAQLYKAMQTVNKVGQALTSGIRLREEEVLELIHARASELMDTDNMYIALYDETTDIVRFGLAFVDGRRVDVETEKGWQPRKAGKGRTEEIIRTKEPIFITTKAEAGAWYAQPGREEYIGKDIWASWLGVPMMVGEKVLGVIATYHRTQDYVYSGDDLAVLQGMADQAAIALDNARLYYSVNQRLQVLVDLGKQLTAAIRRERVELLELVHDQASELMDTGNMYVALYEPDPSRPDEYNPENSEQGKIYGTVHFELAFVDDERIDVTTHKDWQPRKEGKGRTEHVIRTRQPLFHPTQEEGEKWYAEPGHEEYIGTALASWLGVPMMVGGEVLGVIATYHPEQDYVYSGDDLEVLQAMADQAAIAIENAQLYKEARGEVLAAKKLATLGTAIAALQHRINNTFNIIVPNVTRLRKRVDMTDKTIAEILDIIERNARYTSNVIARIQEPLREVEIQDVDVNAVLDDVIGMTKEQWGPDIAVDQDLDDSIPLIQAPIGQVTEVFRNLSDNACRAMSGSGQLIIASCLDGGIISVRVQDTGPGIPPRIQERLFDKPVPSKVPGGGAGLGLWLSQLMLQTIGGKVEIEETGSTGTTMLVQIPAPGGGEVRL